MLYIRSRAVLVVAVCLLCSGFAFAADELALTEPKISDDAKREFLLNAKVVSSKQISKGITSPWKLRLTDGNITWDAAFQSVDERKTSMQFSTGRTEMNFRDSYHFNIAAYELSKLLGLEIMTPVTVERKWSGKTGAISWWVPWKWDEGMRIKDKVQPPDPEGWNQQMHRMRVFSQLVYDTDRNLGNVLITQDWKLWMIDFTRAFRLFNDLENPKNLTRCDKQLLEKLKALKEEEVVQATNKHLTKSEAKAIIQRRDKIVSFFQQLAAQKSEAEVYY